METTVAEQMKTTTSGPAARRRQVPPKSSNADVAAPRQQDLAIDQFFYFFLRLRKGEVRRVVQRVKTLYPDETAEQHARRLILAQSSLSLVGGALLYLPTLFPLAGNVLKLGGFVGGASILTRVNLYLILEIALLFGKDIDDQKRVPEMLAVVGATGLSAASPFLVSQLDWHPAVAIPTSGLSAAAIAKLIGEAAIAYYRRPADMPLELAAAEA